MADFPNIKPDSENIALRSANQIYDSPLTNSRQVGTLAPARWEFTASFNNRYGTEARQLKSFLFGLNGSATPFNYYPAHIEQLGTMQGNGVINGADQTGTTISTKGWEYGQPLLFATGDYLTVNGELKMVTGDVNSTDEVLTFTGYSGTNLMPSPFDPSGWTGATDPDVSYTSVTEANPSGELFVGEFEYVGTGTAPINYSLNNDSTIGDKYYICLLIKAESGTQIGFRFSFQEGATTYAAGTVSAVTGNYSIIGSPPVKVRTKALSDGYILAQIEYVSEYDISNNFDIFTQFYKVSDAGNQITLPSVGDKIKVQAVYFGKNTDWPAQIESNIYIEYSGTNYMPSPFDPSGWTGATDPDLSYTQVTESNPSGGVFVGEFTVVNSTFCQLNQSTYLSSPQNGKYYTCILIKPVLGIDLGLRIITRSISAQIDNSYVNINTLLGTSSLGGAFNNIELSNGYSLIQLELDIQSSEQEIRSEIYMWEVNPSGGPTGFPNIADSVKCQAAYFGRADDWPAFAGMKIDIPITPALRKSPSDGAAIATENPYAIVTLENDDQAQMQVSSPVIYASSFNMLEFF